MSEGPEWFAPSRYGYGAGLPIAWQGWLLLISYVALVVTASLLLPRSILAYIAILFTLTFLFLVICAHTTRGGWRWRWGDPD
jgi:hypothetical protein